eukprot:SAG22_NODE_4_length_44774_cov_362.122149_30_plen_72_part_00
MPAEPGRRKESRAGATEAACTPGDWGCGHTTCCRKRISMAFRASASEVPPYSYGYGSQAVPAGIGPERLPR